MNFSGFMRRAGKLVSDNSPAILTAVAVTGTLTTAYLTGKASFKAAEVIRGEEWRQHKQLSGLDPKEKLELTWKLYLPAAGTAAATIACIIAANQIGTRRTAAVAAAYAISERAYEEYRHKVIEKIGDKKEQSYRDEIAQERIDRNPPPEDMVLLEDGLSVLCCDQFTGRYFLSDMESLRRAQNTINYRVNNDYYASLSAFYELIGLEPTSMSDDFGWNADKLMELEFSTALTPSGKPCLTFDFKVAPIRGYNRLQ